MNDDAVEAVARSLERFGAIAPIIVNEAFEVCAGHTRLKAAIEIGRKTFPVLVVPSLVGADFRGYNIADNQTASLAEWDNEGLAAALRELADEDFDLECLGFDGNELQELLAQTDGSQGRTDADEIPDPPDKPVTKTGDLWLLGDHRLLCGDATKAEDVNRVMGGEKAGLINTDPPYGVDYSKTKDGIPRPGFKNHQEKWGDIKNDGLEGPRLQTFLEAVFRAALPHLNRAAWYLWHAYLTQGFFAAAAAAAADVLLHRQIIWVKPGFVLTRSGMYHWAHEPCFYGWVRGQQPAWLGDKSQRSVWELGRDEDHGQYHPTQKPVALFEIPMENHLHIGEVCYEPFSGSGSQFIAAEQLGRKCYGIEIEPRYVDVCCERFFRFSGKEPVRERGNAKWSNVKRAKRTTEDS
jgi:DNA modification methylase